MNKEDINSYIKRYNERLEQFGYDPRTLGWGENGRQEVRFHVLTQEIFEREDLHSTVLDVGCGFGDLFGFLVNRGWRGKYLGIDIVPSLIEMGRNIYPNADLKILDISSTNFNQNFDYVISSGIFNYRLVGEDNISHIRRMLGRFFKLANKYVASDFLSTKVDFQKEGAWHMEPSIALTEALSISSRVKVMHDYMPYEYCIFLYKDQSISSRRVFKSLEKELKSL